MGRRRRRRRLHRRLRHLGVHAEACRVQPELEEGVRVDVPMFLPPDLQLEEVRQYVLEDKEGRAGARVRVRARAPERTRAASAALALSSLQNVSRTNSKIVCP